MGETVGATVVETDRINAVATAAAYTIHRGRSTQYIARIVKA